MDDFATVQSYSEAAPLAFPARHSQLDLSLTAMTAFCTECDRPVQHLRGIIREFPTCLEVSGAGGCPFCHCLTRFRYRWYPWGVLSLSDQGWVEIPDRPTLCTRLGRWWQRIRKA